MSVTAREFWRDRLAADGRENRSLAGGTQCFDDVDGVEAGPDTILAKAAFPIAALFAHQVATIGFTVLDLARGGHFEPLGKTLVCFSRHRHGCVPIQTRPPVLGEAW